MGLIKLMIDLKKESPLQSFYSVRIDAGALVPLSPLQRGNCF